MADLNAAVRRIFKEAMEVGNMSVVDELIADDFKTDMPAPAPGKEGFKLVLQGWRDAFPDMKFTFGDVIVSGDKVTTRGSVTGTHKGTFNGIPATGKRVEVRFIDIWRMQNGKFVENWAQVDILGILTQIGAVPSPSSS